MNIQLGMRRLLRSVIRFYQNVELFFLKNTRNRLIVFGFVTVLIITVVVVFAASGKASSVAQKPMDPSQSASQQAEVEASFQALTPTPTSTPTPSPTPTPTPTPDPTLRKGDENERVRDLQERLMELNYMVLDESTQFYGSVTQYSVELFQRQHDLNQDGVAGPATLNLLYSNEAKKYTLLKGTVGSDVDSLQRQLIDLGYLNKATGYYGSETESAVEEFQKRNNLSVDGKTGEQTLSLLYSPNAVESLTKVKAELRRANILDFLSAAEAQIGDPYILGNVGPNSFDCSGLVYYCLKQAGSSRSRYNAAGYSQVDAWEKITSMNNLEKGDLLFFSTNGKSVGHVGIYIGNGTMIDASSSNGKVVKRSCVTNFWKTNFVVARRPW